MLAAGECIIVVLCWERLESVDAEHYYKPNYTHYTNIKIYGHDNYPLACANQGIIKVTVMIYTDEMVVDDIH